VSILKWCGIGTALFNVMSVVHACVQCDIEVVLLCWLGDCHMQV
jgi:hypothetical protein